MHLALELQVGTGIIAVGAIARAVPAVVTAIAGARHAPHLEAVALALHPGDALDPAVIALPIEAIAAAVPVLVTATDPLLHRPGAAVDAVALIAILVVTVIGIGITAIAERLTDDRLADILGRPRRRIILRLRGHRAHPNQSGH